MTLAAVALALSVQLETAVMGGVLCAETRGLEHVVGAAAARAERAAIVQVARNRARLLRRPLLAVLLQPRQFATSCSSSKPAGYVRLAADVLGGRVAPPAWSARAVAFVAPSAAARVAGRWARWGWARIPDTGTVHTFFEGTP